MNQLRDTERTIRDRTRRVAAPARAARVSEYKRQGLIRRNSHIPDQQFLTSKHGGYFRESRTCAFPLHAPESDNERRQLVIYRGECSINLILHNQIANRNRRIQAVEVPGSERIQLLPCAGRRDSIAGLGQGSVVPSGYFQPLSARR
jgi:hypothetical protein